MITLRSVEQAAQTQFIAGQQTLWRNLWLWRPQALGSDELVAFETRLHLSDMQLHKRADSADLNSERDEGKSQRTSLRFALPWICPRSIARLHRALCGSSARIEYQQLRGTGHPPGLAANQASRTRARRPKSLAGATCGNFAPLLSGHSKPKSNGEFMPGHISILALEKRNHTIYFDIGGSNPRRSVSPARSGNRSVEYSSRPLFCTTSGQVHRMAPEAFPRTLPLL